MHDGGAVGRFRLAALDERVAVELLAHGRTHGAGAAAVDDPHERQPASAASSTNARTASRAS